MTSPLIHREATRRVHVRYKVEAIVETFLTVSDQQVREGLDLDPDEEITDDVLAEYVTETTDESVWDLRSIEFWDQLDEVDIGEETTHMVAPPTFVPLPGMEGL